MPKITWTIDNMLSAYESREPPNEKEDEETKILTLRWELDLFPDDCDYTLEELEEMKNERNEEGNDLSNRSL